MEIEHKHPFGHDEAKTRARALADYLSARHGMQVEWNGEDGFQLRGKYMVVSIDATVKILPDKVQVTGPDPGMLWRSPAKTYIAKKLNQYMDPKAGIDGLPRA